MSSSGREAKADPMIGQTLSDRYKILEVVGKGGMGVVYKARHELMDRIVAVKMLTGDCMKDDISVKRFQREAKAACKLTHQNIIAMHDFFFLEKEGEDKIPFLVMDFIEGESLSEVIKREGQVPVARAIDIMIQVCDALYAAHAAGIVHRDLKPGNIMLLKNSDGLDIVKVVDFGVAKIAYSPGEESQRLTQTGEVFGSPVYMSPEQCKGEQLGPTSDIYGMGIVLYEALTGKLPLAGNNVVETITKHLTMQPPRFSEVRKDLFIPEQLEAIVMKCLQKNTEDRPSTMADLKEELLRCKPGGKPLDATFGSLGNLAETRANREARSLSTNTKILVVLGVMALIGTFLGGLGIFFYMSSHQKQPQPIAKPVEPTKPVEKTTAVTPPTEQTKPGSTATEKTTSVPTISEKTTTVKDVTPDKPKTNTDVKSVASVSTKPAKKKTKTVVTTAELDLPPLPPKRTKVRHESLDWAEYSSKQEGRDWSKSTLPVDVGQ